MTHSPDPLFSAPSAGALPHDGSPRTGLLHKIETGTARIAVIGLGYVGLPLAVEFAKRFPTVGIDINETRVGALREGRSYIGDVPDDEIAPLLEEGSLRAETDFAALADADCAIICVPTPLEAGAQPDISFIVAATEQIARHLHHGQLVVLESTTYPGTTDEIMLPLLSAGGLCLDRDFFLAFSPERVDPGNPDYKIRDIPKIVGGTTVDSTAVASALYGRIVPFVHRVSSTRVAETAKLWENTFRAVNIALANEMALLCRSLAIETSEVIAAAATKPFGFMPFYPGPGVGGHCIPIDPQYLSWTASKYGFYPRLISIADQINRSMADHVVDLVSEALNDEAKALRGSRILVLGVAYKPDVEDVRMSPSIAIIERLRSKGATVRYHDAFVPRLKVEDAEQPPAPRRDLREDRVERRQSVTHDLADSISEGRRRSDPLESRELTGAEVRGADCVLVLAAHTEIDYDWVGRTARTIVDTRNVVPSNDSPGAARLITL